MLYIFIENEIELNQKFRLTSQKRGQKHDRASWNNLVWRVAIFNTTNLKKKLLDLKYWFDN